MGQPARGKALTAGQVLIDGQDVAGLRAAERNIAMVFQSYALYPHMTVRQKTARGGGPGADPEARIKELAAEVRSKLKMK